MENKAKKWFIFFKTNVSFNLCFIKWVPSWLRSEKTGQRRAGAGQTGNRDRLFPKRMPPIFLRKKLLL